jgi:hypothetical protein
LGKELSISLKDAAGIAYRKFLLPGSDEMAAIAAWTKRA